MYPRISRAAGPGLWVVGLVASTGGLDAPSQVPVVRTAAVKVALTD